MPSPYLPKHIYTSKQTYTALQIYTAQQTGTVGSTSIKPASNNSTSLTGAHIKLVLILFLFFSALVLQTPRAHAGDLNQESTQVFGDYTVHYSAFNSTFILPDIATNYGLVRAKNQILLNITVQNKQGESIPAKFEGYSQNLMQQKKPLEFKEITERYAVYYMSGLRVTNEEVRHFFIDITPEGAEPFTLKFTRKLYTED